MEFRENIHFALGARGLSVKELAAKSGVNENTLKTYLKQNGAEPTISKAAKLAKALDVSLDFLASETDDGIKYFKKPKLKNSPLQRPPKNPKISEIEWRLSKCTQKQLNAILAVAREFIAGK